MPLTCIQSLISKSKGKLQPIILTAIKSLLQDGEFTQSAELVKNKCVTMHPNTNWNSRITAICNAMRNTNYCGSVIISEDRDHNNFTIQFSSSTIKKKQKKQYKLSLEIVLKTSKEKEIPKIKNTKKQNFLTIAPNKRKLLILGCSDSKSKQKNNFNNGNEKNYNFGTDLNNLYKQRHQYYQGLSNSYFKNKKRDNELVNKAYFMECLNSKNRRSLFDVYGGNKSPFFNSKMKDLYIQKIQNSNLTILIVSGLYGLLKDSDFINDYHLEIKKGPNIWKKTISNAINDFIINNDIENSNVFYCLSSKYLPFIGQPQHNWTNLWRNLGGRGHNQANELFDFLSHI